MNKEKGFINYILLGTIVIMLMAGTYYLGRFSNNNFTVEKTIENKDVSLPSSSIESDTKTSPSPAIEEPKALEEIVYKPMSTWNTYTDDQAKFLIQYPENFSISEYSTSKGGSVDFRIKGAGNYFCMPGFETGGCLSGYMVLIKEDYDGGSRRAWFDRKHPDLVREREIKEYKIAGVNSLLIFNKEFGTPLGVVALIPRNKEMFEIYFYFSSPEGSSQKIIEDRTTHIQKILPTFKFL